MFLNDQKLNLRKAELNDRDQMVRLLQKRSFIHRHLGWFSPLEWLGEQPYLVLDNQSRISAALACPPDDDGITWLHLFAVTPGMLIPQAWKALWPPALEWLEEYTTVRQVNSLVVQDKMNDLLSGKNIRIGCSYKRPDSWLPNQYNQSAGWALGPPCS